MSPNAELTVPLAAFRIRRPAGDGSGSLRTAGIRGGMLMARKARWRYDERARAARLTAPAAGVKARLSGRSRFAGAKARPWAEREGHGPMAAA